jgi:uncharacterized membrane protein YcaP (DUF421 family)
MDVLESVFGTQGHVVWWQECARAALVFGYGLLLVRIAGRRMFGKWSALDIIVAIMIGSNLSRAITGSAPLFGTLVATALLIGLHAILAQAVARSARFSRLVEGSVVELVRGGHVNERHLRRESVSQADLDEALRQFGVEHPGETRLVALEPSGKITVLKTS